MRLLGGNDEPRMKANRREVDPSRELRVETVTDVVSFDSDEWVLDKEGNRVFTRKLRFDDPPIAVHFPVETLSAADNELRKSEQDAYARREITRYSKVVRNPDAPGSKVELDTPYSELWV